IVGNRTTGGRVGYSRSFVVGVGVHRRRSGVLGGASGAVLVDLEVAPWVCVAAPWGHRPGFDRFRIEPRHGGDAWAHYSRRCVVGGHDARGVARDNDRGRFTARAVGAPKRWHDLSAEFAISVSRPAE